MAGTEPSEAHRSLDVGKMTKMLNFIKNQGFSMVYEDFMKFNISVIFPTSRDLCASVRPQKPENVEIVFLTF